MASSFRLSFGIPLEDLCPVGMHPTLKKLFEELIKRLECCSCNKSSIVRGLLRNDLVTQNQAQFLENLLTMGEPLNNLPIPTLIWLLRHILGSLPIPLLPKYTDSKTFSWYKLSTKCYSGFHKYIENKAQTDILINNLSDELLRLPRVNLLFIGYFIKFLRRLVIHRGMYNKMCRGTAITLVHYFSASLFIRPYNPRTQPKTGGRYHSLLLYLIVKWPEVRYSCLRKYPNSFTTMEDHTTRRTQDERVSEYLRRQADRITFKDSSTQTSTEDVVEHRPKLVKQTFYIENSTEELDEPASTFPSNALNKTVHFCNKTGDSSSRSTITSTETGNNSKESNSSFLCKYFNKNQHPNSDNINSGTEEDNFIKDDIYVNLPDLTAKKNKVDGDINTFEKSPLNSSRSSLDGVSPATSSLGSSHVENLEKSLVERKTGKNFFAKIKSKMSRLKKSNERFTNRWKYTRMSPASSTSI